MRFWFGRKAAPDARALVPAWLQASESGGFARSYDHSSCGMTGAPTPTDQPIGTGDGEVSRFDLIKAYGTGETRRITRPVPGSVRVAVDGVERLAGWSLVNGAIVFDEPPAVGSEISTGFLFDVLVRFAEDRIDINRATFLAGEAPSVPLVEIREA
jgi:uncharacterized protein (TIGR02217 family)